MALRVSNIRLAVEDPETTLPDRLARSLGIQTADIQRWRILRKSLDARDRQIQFVYSAEVQLLDEQKILQHKPRFQSISIETYSEAPFIMPPCGSVPMVPDLMLPVSCKCLLKIKANPRCFMISDRIWVATDCPQWLNPFEEKSRP